MLSADLREARERAFRFRPSPPPAAALPRDPSETDMHAAKGEQSWTTVAGHPSSTLPPRKLLIPNESTIDPQTTNWLARRAGSLQ
jgi:hypothetical protein